MPRHNNDKHGKKSKANKGAKRKKPEHSRTKAARKREEEYRKRSRDIAVQKAEQDKLPARMGWPKPPNKKDHARIKGDKSHMIIDWTKTATF